MAFGHPLRTTQNSTLPSRVVTGLVSIALRISVRTGPFESLGLRAGDLQFIKCRQHLGAVVCRIHTGKDFRNLTLRIDEERVSCRYLCDAEVDKRTILL